VTEALDEVDAADGPRAPAQTGSGKFWSNGLDLDWLTANLDQAGSYVEPVQGLFARYLELTVRRWRSCRATRSRQAPSWPWPTTSG